MDRCQCCPFVGCESRYARRSDLIKHLKKHDAKRGSFVCPCCSCVYASNSSLLRHFSKAHPVSSNNFCVDEDIVQDEVVESFVNTPPKKRVYLKSFYKNFLGVRDGVTVVDWFVFVLLFNKVRGCLRFLFYII